MWVCVPPAHVPVLTPPPDPGTGDLYTMDDSQLVSDKSPLEEPPDLPGLRCAASPPLHAAGPFSLLPAGPPPAPLLAGPGSPPTLHGTCHTRTGRCPPAGRSSPPRQLAPRQRGGGHPAGLVLPPLLPQHLCVQAERGPHAHRCWGAAAGAGGHPRGMNGVPVRAPAPGWGSPPCRGCPRPARGGGAQPHGPWDGRGLPGVMGGAGRRPRSAVTSLTLAPQMAALT